MLYSLFWFYLFACLVFVKMVNDQFTTKLDPKSSISAAIPASNKWLNKSISGKRQHTQKFLFYSFFL